jgi:hypothetical protein
MAEHSPLNTDSLSPKDKKLMGCASGVLLTCLAPTCLALTIAVGANPQKPNADVVFDYGIHNQTDIQTDSKSFQLNVWVCIPGVRNCLQKIINLDVDK